MGTAGAILYYDAAATQSAATELFALSDPRPEPNQEFGARFRYSANRNALTVNSPGSIIQMMEGVGKIINFQRVGNAFVPISETTPLIIVGYTPTPAKP